MVAFLSERTISHGRFADRKQCQHLPISLHAGRVHTQLTSHLKLSLQPAPSLPAISICQYNPHTTYQPSQTVSTTRTQLTSHLKLSVQPAPSLPAISNCQYNPHTACVQALISNPVFSSTDALCVSFSLK